MKDKDLLKEVKKLGLIFLEKENPIDVNEILYDVITSKEMRLLEGFPVLLANAMEAGGFDYKKIINKFKNAEDKSIFVNFIELSLAVYKYHQLEFDWKNALLNRLSEDEKKKLSTFLVRLQKNRTFHISNYQFSSERIKNIFLNYYRKEEGRTREVVKKQEELSLEYALSQVFPPKQRNLFKKKLRGEKMTKTEKEYFSRIVKKKIIALSNPELHDMARKILEQG